ncbi:hypothetical protein [Tatumella sp. JGM118]|uniref:hypothetical protein n=1 Tax=Tatumella sp. JGM118 TaxID=2799796 RepID=UPI001BAFC33A|nr:hypothetical protein [Tatumella sp. JGM118]MBS0909175.1 hypothetical protein [Tatumella sp. JGM118]
MKKAYYYASKKTKFVVVYLEDGSEWFSKSVSGKASARLIAKEAEATCWNF